MTLPSSQPLPDKMEDLPPNRRRQIRKVPQSATPGERQLMLETFFRKMSPSLDFFLLSLFGAILTGLAILMDEVMAISLAAAVVLPFASPIFALSLLPAAPNAKKALSAFLALLINSTLIFGAGALSGWLGGNFFGDRINTIGHHFTQINGGDLFILALSTIISAIRLVRREKLPRIAGILVSYELAFPLAIAGFGLMTGKQQLWPAALLLGGVHAGLVILLSLLTFLVLGFPPKGLPGWLLTFLAAVAFLLAFIFTPLGISSPFEKPALSLPTDTQTPMATVVENTTIPTPSSTQTAIPSSTATRQPTATQTATVTPTPEPTTYWGIVSVQDGAVIREAPGFEALVVAYANNGDLIEILGETVLDGNNLWMKVRTGTGETGWMVSSLIITPTP